jgi:hypothetical protein
MRMTRLMAATLLIASPALAQAPTDPFPTPIAATEGVIRVNYVEFATIPDIDGVAARMMTMVDEPGTDRLFVSDMRGPLYFIDYDGETVREYVNVNDAEWGVPVQSMGRERGIQSFTFHPQFGQQGTPGYGKFYTWMDTSDTIPAADFRPSGGGHTHDSVLLEWTARNARAGTYDGGPPRELARFHQPYANHNGGALTFNSSADPGDADFGLLYLGIGDGGSGGDPNSHAQNLASGFGKIFRIDPLGRNSPNGKYGIPPSNPFVSDNNPATLGEIYAYGVRNPQRFGWDPENGNMYMSDIGQGTVEELSPVTAGANLGWNIWEGSYRFVNGAGVDVAAPRSDPSITYPIAEYSQLDPLLQTSSAATGVHVYRDGDVDQLEGKILWGDFPSGEIFYVSADNVPRGGQDPIRRVLLNDQGQARTVLQLIQAKNTAQGKTPATRADMRLGIGPEGRVFIINKQDGVIREIVE